MMNNESSYINSIEEERICPACGVVIRGDVAYFKVGKPGSMEFLAARVCQYTKRSGKTELCINKSFNKDDNYRNTYEDDLQELTSKMSGMNSLSNQGFDRDS